MTASPRTLAAIGLVLAWGLPEIVGPVFAGDAMPWRLAREAAWWGIGVAVLGWVMLAERRPIASIGLVRPRPATLGWGALFLVLMMASVMLSFAVILPALGLHQDMATTRKLVAVPLWLQCATMVRAGVVEEIVYRGYALTRLETLTGRTWIAAPIAMLAFVAAHHGWGGSQLVVVAFGAVLLTTLFLWKRDLPACMIAHAATDLIGFALARAQM